MEKKRSPNFTAKEEMLLVSLAKTYACVLECKLSNTNANEEKAGCWLKIANEFNSVSETFRTSLVLRKKYENIKKRTKRKYADERKYIRGTGGGPNVESTFTSVDSEIKEMLGVRLKGNESEFDGDATGMYCRII